MPADLVTVDLQLSSETDWGMFPQAWYRNIGQAAKRLVEFVQSFRAHTRVEHASPSAQVEKPVVPVFMVQTAELAPH